MKLFEKDSKNEYRLIREALPDEIEKAKVNKDVIYVLKKSRDAQVVLFVHANKIGKKIYRINKSKVCFDMIKTGNFSDNLSAEMLQKLKLKK
jgi:hypothetical protein